MIETQSHQNYLQSTIKIGSCKGPVSYKHNQVVFHHDDIPEEKRQRKNDVLDWKKSNLLSCEKNSWNLSTEVEKHPCKDKKKMTNHVHDRKLPYQYNFRSETLDYLNNLEHPDKSNKFHISLQTKEFTKEIEEKKTTSLLYQGHLKRNQEMPIHPNLENATSWNNSTYFDRKSYTQQLSDLTSNSLNQTSKLKNEIPTILSQKGKKYESPQTKTESLLEEVRRQKSQGIFDPNRNISLPVPEEVDPRTLRNRFAIEKSKVFYTNKHSGVWEYNPIEKRHMWSDTGSFDYNSRGDVVLKHDPEAYNFEGPTNAPIRSAASLSLTSSGQAPSSSSSSTLNNLNSTVGGKPSKATRIDEQSKAISAWTEYFIRKEKKLQDASIGRRENMTA